MTKRDSVTEQMKSKNIQSLVDRRDDQDLMFLRKIEFDDFNIHLEDYMHKNEFYNTCRGVIGSSKHINVFKNHFYNRMEPQVKFLFSS